MNYRLLTLATAITVATATTALTAARIPVVLDTDIGGDIDDTWALAHVLRSPELDLKLVLTDTGDARYRAEVAAKFLEVAGRADVDVGLGRDFGTMGDSDRHQGPWLRGYDLTKYPGRVHEDGVQALIDLVMASTETVTIIAIGPVPTLAAALEREPRIAERCRFVGMHGSFHVGYGGGEPSPEWNVRAYPAELRAVFAAPWKDILITPLDTCDGISVSGERYNAIWSATGDPVLRALIENYCIWAPRVPWMHCDFFATRSSSLFDCVAVWLAYSEELVEIETVKFRITDDGFTIPDEAGPLEARVALRWRDRAAFDEHLATRLMTPR